MSEKTLNVKLLTYTPDSEKVIASAARLCYSEDDINTLLQKVDNKDNTSFIEKLISYNHLSPFEHVSFTFGIEGISRSLSHQLIRHRLASYSQKSQRYTGLKNGIDYVIPDAIKNNPNALEIFNNAITTLDKAYELLNTTLYNDKLFQLLPMTPNVYDKETRNKISSIANKFANENARCILPNATETKLIMTMNARELLHFFLERCCNNAQDEIRNMAWLMLKLVYDIAPTIFKYAGPSCIKGNCKEGKRSCGNPYTKLNTSKED